MIRLSTCQLCLLNRTRASKRCFSITKVKWKKPAAAAPLIKPSGRPESEKKFQVDSPQRFVEPPTPVVLSALKLNTLEKESNRVQQQLLKVNDVKIDKCETNLSNEEVEVKPVKLLNAVDPIILDKSVKLELKDLPGYYLGLSKFRLTGLVVVTAMAGYALAPAPFLLGPLLGLSVGTALTSAAANTVNQIVEVPYDSQMDRTKNRVLVRGRLSPEHAAAFAVISGISGLAILNFGVNTLTAALGGINLLLYTCMYTPLKRHSIVNTWVGSVVGGIPPLMGWAACTGELSHGALLLGGILYAWQFPHFNALSWNLKNDYGKAGYKMMAVTHPELCKKTALRYSVSLIVMSSLAPVCDVTSWTFALDSLPLNGYLVFLAYKFYKEGDSSSSRKLFRFSLIHLPALIMLMMISKQNWRQEKCSNATNKSIISEIESQTQKVDPVLASIGESIILHNSIAVDSCDSNNSSNPVETHR